MKTEVLITGATGFLGSALTQRMKEDGRFNVRALGSKDCDLTDPDGLRRLDLPKCDLVFHLAAWTQAGDFCLRHPGEQWLINQKINTNVLDWWHAQQPQAKLIAVGTSCSYAEQLPHIEENYLVGEPTPSLFTYAMTKRMLYAGLLALNKQFGHRYLHVIPSTLYGPGYHEDGRQMHFIFDLIRKILCGKHHDQPVVLWGDGHQRRELIYRDDFIWNLLSLTASQDNSSINIGAGEDHSIRDFANQICELVGFDFGRIEFDTSKYVGAQAKRLHIDRLNHLLPNRPQTPLQRGLQQTIDWMSARPELFAV